VRISSTTLSAVAPFGLLIAVVMILYGQTLGFGYVWDDGSLFVDNTVLREGVWSWEAVARPILPDTPYFRPLVMSTWMLEMQLFKLNPMYSHAINIALHAINTCLLYKIARNVFEKSRNASALAFWLALVYTVHPCLVEGVAWISGRFDLLATTLILAGCSVAMLPATLGRCAMAGIFALCAMLSKETGVLFAPLLVLIYIARQPLLPLVKIISALSPYLLAYFLAVVAYFIMRSHGLGFLSYESFGFSQVVEAIIRYEVWLRTLSFYTWISFIPFSSISPRHDLLMELESGRQHVVALFASLFLLIVVLVNAIRRKPWALLWSGFYIGIFPVLGVFGIRLGETIGAERFLYLPLAMLSLALGGVFLALREKYVQYPAIPRLAVIMAGGWILLSSLVTYTVASMWESNLQLWSWQYKINPKNELVRTLYLVALTNEKSDENSAKLRAEVERIRLKNNDRLPMDVQIIYSAYLLRSNDPEALPYLEGLVLNAESIWRKQGGGSDALNGVTFHGILANYSQALMVFEGDLEQAKLVLQRAEAINARGSEYQVVHQRIVVEYLVGQKEAALEMYRKNFDLLNAYDIRQMHQSMRTLVALTCKRKNDNNCAEQAQQFIDYIKE